jgi:hypothetical protein
MEHSRSSSHHKYIRYSDHSYCHTKQNTILINSCQINMPIILFDFLLCTVQYTFVIRRNFRIV